MFEHEYTVSEKEVINFKKRSYVRRIFRAAIEKGEVVNPHFCHLCDKAKKTEAHHIDYGKPYVVTWLCRACHGKVHCRDHPLNPNNNQQTAMPHVVEEYKFVTVSFELPIKTFLALKQEAENQKKSIGKIMREKTEKLFPIQSPQLEFNLEMPYDKPQNVEHERIQSLATNERLREQPKCAVLSTVWREGSDNLRGVGSKLFQLSSRHGDDAGGVQRIRVAGQGH